MQERLYNLESGDEVLNASGSILVGVAFLLEEESNQVGTVELLNVKHPLVANRSFLRHLGVSQFLKQVHQKNFKNGRILLGIQILILLN